MSYDFNQTIERRGTDSAKWSWYEEGVLPLWVADMDFAAPEPVLRALHRRIEHGVFGYSRAPQALAEVLCERMAQLYGWQITPADILFLPGLVSGMNIVCRATGRPGSSVLVQPPVYPPFLSAPGNHDQTLAIANLDQVGRGRTFDYEIDYDRFEAAITPETRLFMLCNPHNPIGRGFSAEELARMGEICLRHELIICSDEIHSDLMLGGTRHVATAAVSPEIAERCITLIAPSKTFNLPGLGCSAAIVQNAALREKLEKAKAGIVPHVNTLGYVAALAAYTECQDWLDDLLVYLTANRDFLVDYVTQNFPNIRMTVPQATYLAWLDCREAGLGSSPYEFFLEEAKVALNEGAWFGQAGEGFVRLNFGCPRSILAEALERMAEALAKRS
jgi:cystathionine beta-lyase